MVFGGEGAKALHGKFTEKGFKAPENFDVVEEKHGMQFWAGGNDWEPSWTAMAAYDKQRDERLWFVISYEDGKHPGNESISKETTEENNKRVRDILKRWIKTSAEYRKKEFPDSECRLNISDVAEGLKAVAADVEKYGLERKTFNPSKHDPLDDEELER
jgi:hypothetical protein